MSDDEARRDKFNADLIRAHSRRYALKIGDIIDARNVAATPKATAAETASSAPAETSSWKEARVSKVDWEVVEIHFLGDSDQLGVTIDRLSCDIQPRHTFTRSWQEDLKEGSFVQVWSTLENNSGRIGGRERGSWERGVVLKIGRDVDDVGGDGDGDGDGDEVYDDVDRAANDIQLQQEGRPDKPRMVLVETTDTPSSSSSSSSSSRVNVNTIRRWVDINALALCPGGTRLGHTPTTTRHDSSISASEPGSPARSSSTSSKEAVPPCQEAAEDRCAPGCMKRVALVGSSGGGAAAQGQFDALSLLRLAQKELRRAGIQLAAVQFVACADPLDIALPTSPATLWVSRGRGDGGQELAVAAEGHLSVVNVAAKKEDVKIAAALRASGDQRPQEGASARSLPSVDAAGASAAAGVPLPLHGVVAISCDVDGVNSETLSAARDCNAPVVGTGGTSLGTAMAMGCHLVGSSGGSVATTNKSKVVSYAAGLAGHWRLGYDSAKELMQPLSPAAVFAGCLPAQVGVMVALALGPSSAATADGPEVAPWMGRLVGAVPVVAAAVAARQVSTLGDMSTAAGIIAGSMCMDDILAALVAGTLAGYLCSKLTGCALDLGIPATALSLYATATSGILSGALVLTFLPFLRALRALIVSTEAFFLWQQAVWIQGIAGAGMGCLMCYGSKVGWYHRIFLPVIVLELSDGGGSVWGAIDLCALCMVAAGLCAAHMIRPSTQTDIPLARRGFLFNLCFGDFVESAYPFMERCGCCNVGAYLGSALSGAVVATGRVTSTAYLPLPLAVMACSKPGWLIAATSAAFLPAFASGLLRPLAKTGRRTAKEPDGSPCCPTNSRTAQYAAGERAG